ncbi:MAG: hypothetical protein JKY98_05250 [Gammaproteobacteria bacterium]|nr:hypothetical protein [Gammaproteobacteria bacterium]
MADYHIFIIAFIVWGMIVDYFRIQRTYWSFVPADLTSKQLVEGVIAGLAAYGLHDLLHLIWTTLP